MAVALEGVSITGVLHGGIGYDHVVPIVGQYGLEPITLLLKLLIPLQILWVLGLTFSKISTHTYRPEQVNLPTTWDTQNQ